MVEKSNAYEKGEMSGGVNLDGIAVDAQVKNRNISINLYVGVG